MAYPVSAAFKAALSASQHTVVTEAQVWNGNKYVATVPTVSGGHVAVTATAEIRRTCTVTIQSSGRTLDSWVPVNPGDLLHPASGNELRLYRGFRYAGGITELVPLGVFEMTKVKVTDTQSGLSIQIAGSDRAWKVKRQSFTKPYAVAAGTKLATLIQAIVSARISGVQFSLYPTSVTLAAATLAATPASSTNDPWGVLQTFAAGFGLELYFDPLGICTLAPIPTPKSETQSWDYAEGQNCTITGQINKTLDETGTYNGVICIGNGKAKTGAATTTSTAATIPPVTASKWTENPDSPTYVGGPWGKVPFFITTTAIPAPGMTHATAQTAITAMAAAQFNLVVVALNNVTFTCIPNPAMEEGDVLMLTRKRMGVGTRYVVSGINIPLSPKTPMTVTLRPQTQVVGA